MTAAYDLEQIPKSHLLACGAKLVAMLIHEIDNDDAFACLLSIQGSIEVFAAQAATPLEIAMAQSMRLMAEEMMRRNPNRHHPHGTTARQFIERTQTPRLRFRPLRKA